MAPKESSEASSEAADRLGVPPPLAECWSLVTIQKEAQPSDSSACTFNPTCICVNIHVCMHLCIQIFVYIYTHIYTCTYVYISTWICKFICGTGTCAFVYT